MTPPRVSRRRVPGTMKDTPTKDSEKAMAKAMGKTQ